MTRTRVFTAGLLGVVTVLLVVLGTVRTGRGDQPQAEKQLLAYLDHLAGKLLSERKVPATLAEWEGRRGEIHTAVLKMLGLYPLPEKTALNVQYVGQPVEVSGCTFRRVVFESRPGSHVAAHLFIPKHVTFPVPGIVYAPSSVGRDAYTGHCVSLASMGFVVINMPHLGTEGRRGVGYGHRGHLGPSVGKNWHWYSTGFHPLSVLVWDDMRAVDFLLTLKDAKSGKAMVDGERLGTAGMSLGCPRALWTAAADERIKSVVAMMGWSSVHGSYGAFCHHCDTWIFYNYAGLSLGEIYGSIAPRALLSQVGRKDMYSPHPQRVGDFVAQVYKLYGKSERFNDVIYNTGHWYGGRVQRAEKHWHKKWLEAAGPTVAPETNGQFEANRQSLRKKENLNAFTGSEWQGGWKLFGKPVKTVDTEKLFTIARPRWDVTDTRSFERFKTGLGKALREEVLRRAFLPLASRLKRGDVEAHDGWRRQEMTLTVDEKLSHRATFSYVHGVKRPTVILLSDVPLAELRIDPIKLLDAGVNLLCLEPTGIGGTRIAPDDQRRHVLRFAIMVGHTLTSLRVNDALAAGRELMKHEAVDAGQVYLWGKGDMALPALYAGVVEERFAGVILEDAPDSHMSERPETALMFILRHSDVPRSAGLLYPRPIALVGKTSPGFAWTKALYRTLGRPDRFLEAKSARDALDRLGNPPP